LRCSLVATSMWIHTLRIYLSILYLRCVYLRNRSSRGAFHKPFNSLFEMPVRLLPHQPHLLKRLSILYLRCASLFGGTWPWPPSAPLSILYLRCQSLPKPRLQHGGSFCFQFSI